MTHPSSPLDLPPLGRDSSLSVPPPPLDPTLSRRRRRHGEVPQGERRMGDSKRRNAIAREDGNIKQQRGNEPKGTQKMENEHTHEGCRRTPETRRGQERLTKHVRDDRCGWNRSDRSILRRGNVIARPPPNPTLAARQGRPPPEWKVRRTQGRDREELRRWRRKPTLRTRPRVWNLQVSAKSEQAAKPPNEPNGGNAGDVTTRPFEPTHGRHPTAKSWVWDAACPEKSC